MGRAAEGEQMMLVPGAISVMSVDNKVADVREVRDQVDSLGNKPGGLPAKVIKGVQGKLVEKPGEVVVDDRDEARVDQANQETAKYL